MLYRVGRQQAESIANKEHQGEQWYNCLIREGDLVQEFAGVPQEIAVKVSYPAVQMPKELGTQSDCCNERYSLVDLEHLMSYLHFLLKSGSWGDCVCIEMISKMWGLKITVLDATYKHELWERRVRHNLPLEQADVVVLFLHNHYSAVVRRKRFEARKPPRIVRVPVKGLTGLPGLQMDFTSYEDDGDNGSDAESSDPFWKSWTTNEKPRQEQEYVTIQKEIYESLVRFFKSHWGLTFPDTLDIVCPFCDQEFKFSRNLRQHCRKEHKTVYQG